VNPASGGMPSAPSNRTRRAVDESLICTRRLSNEPFGELSTNFGNLLLGNYELYEAEIWQRCSYLYRHYLDFFSSLQLLFYGSYGILKWTIPVTLLSIFEIYNSETINARNLKFGSVVGI
jgi:hypothetical protein